MNLHEFQGKDLLSRYGVNIQRGYVASNSKESLEIAKKLNKETGTKWWVIKAQVHAGGRGKGGGVKLAKNLNEEVAEKTPEKIFYEHVNPKVGLLPFQCRKIAFNLKLHGNAYKEMVKFVKCLYEAYLGSDSSLFEINPVLKTSDDKILAVDCKVSLDNNALFRHKDLVNLRDKREEDPDEVEAQEFGLNFIKLDGNVGCMVNGAGLAMATMDIIKQSGGSPANFLDVGGTADAERVEQAFRIILKDKKVKALLINIFGGIVRCDRVAQGVVDACKNIGNIEIPLIVRLQGTNAVEAKKLIDESGLKVESVILLKEAAEKITEVLS